MDAQRLIKRVADALDRKSGTTLNATAPQLFKQLQIGDACQVSGNDISVALTQVVTDALGDTMQAIKVLPARDETVNADLVAEILLKTAAKKLDGDIPAKEEIEADAGCKLRLDSIFTAFVAKLEQVHHGEEREVMGAVLEGAKQLAKFVGSAKIAMNWTSLTMDRDNLRALVGVLETLPPSKHESLFHRIFQWIPEQGERPSTEAFAAKVKELAETLPATAGVN